ncbi:MAG: hypothetical protein Q9171_003637 [Xanthocarpia ochracea]
MPRRPNSVGDDVPSPESPTESQQGISRTPRKASSFPFEKLPTELKLMIVQLAMPQHGLRPMCRFTRSEERHNATDNKLWYKKHQREGLPTSLFYTNKWLSAAALATAYQQVPFCINIYPWGIRFHDRSIFCVDFKRTPPSSSVQTYHFRSHIYFKELRQFRFMRNYRLNVLHDASWNRTCTLEDRDATYTRDCRIFKEQLRLISDSLAVNDNIQSLSISVPCCCSSRVDHQPGEPYFRTLESLKPLRRLRVTKPLVLRAVYDNGSDGLKGDVWLNACSRPGCQHLAEVFQASLGHLDGDQLTHEEETWRRIKDMHQGHAKIARSKTIRSLHNLWEQLNLGQEHAGGAEGFHKAAKGDFEIMARIAEKNLARKCGAAVPEPDDAPDEGGKRQAF